MAEISNVYFEWNTFLEDHPFPGTKSGTVHWTINYSDEDPNDIVISYGGMFHHTNRNRYIHMGTNHHEIDTWLRSAVKYFQRIYPAHSHEVTYCIDEDSMCYSLLIFIDRLY
jgi:hypothetical protein